jgi:hypothetical protein
MAAFLLQYLSRNGAIMETQSQTSYRKVAAGFFAVIFLAAGMAVVMYTGLI